MTYNADLERSPNAIHTTFTIFPVQTGSRNSTMSERIQIAFGMRYVGILEENKHLDLPGEEGINKQKGKRIMQNAQKKLVRMGLPNGRTVYLRAEGNGIDSLKITDRDYAKNVGEANLSEIPKKHGPAFRSLMTKLGQ